MKSEICEKRVGQKSIFSDFYSTPINYRDFFISKKSEDKTYTVSKSKKFLDYFLQSTCKNNKITSANGGTFKAVLGNFSNTSVKWYLENKLGNNSCSNTKFNECCQPNNKHMDIIKKY